MNWVSVVSLFRATSPQLYTAWKNTARTGGYGLLIAILLYVLLSREVYAGNSTFWFLIIASLTAARMLLGLYFTRWVEDDLEIHASLGIYVIMTVAVSIAWGGVIYLLPTDSPPQIDVITTATISLLAIIGMVSSYTVFLGAIAYLFPVIGMQIFWMALYQPPFFLWIIILLLLFAVVMLAIMIAINKQFFQIDPFSNSDVKYLGRMDKDKFKEYSSVSLQKEKQAGNIKYDFASLIEAMPDAILIINSDNKIAYVNQSCLNKFSYLRDELLNKKFEALVSEQVANQYKIKNAIERSTTSLKIVHVKEVFLHRNQGDIFSADIMMVPSLDEEYIYIYIRDTSDQKYVDAYIDEIKQKELAQNQLISEKERLQTYVDSIESILVVINEDLEIELINNNGRKFLGRGSEDLLSFDDIDGLLKRNYQDNTRQFVHNILESKINEINFYQNSVIGRDDETHYLEWYLARTTDRNGRHYVLASGIDISQRKRLEELITSVAVSLQSHGKDGILNSLAKGLAATLGADGVYIASVKDDMRNYLQGLALYCDGIFLENTELSISNSPLAKTLHGQNHAILSELDVKYPDDFLIKRLSAKAYLSVPLYSSDREILGVLALFYHHDLTNINLERNICNIYSVIAAAEIERLKNIHAKEHVKRQLQQAQKMESIGQLTGGVAHDFNNMLASMLGFTELALLKLDSTDTKLLNYLNNIYETGEKARDLVAQMLTFSRQIHGEMQLLDLTASVNEAVNMVRPMLPSSISIHIKANEKIPFIEGDSVQLNQAIVNLIINARDAVGEKGKINISITVNENIQAYCTSCLQALETRMLEISVSDTGGGIVYDKLERIFEPFVTSKDIGKGTGMGLAMVHGIVHEHGGHVVVETEQGYGSKFRLLFPISEKIAEESYTVEVSTLDTREGTGKSIMVVDDEVMVATLLKEILTNYHYAVDTFTNSGDALKAYQMNPEKYDLIITDHTMPDLTGAELSEKILKLNPDQPIILCTGYSDYMNEEKAEELGIAAFMHKPLDHSELMHTVYLLTDIRH